MQTHDVSVYWEHFQTAFFVWEKWERDKKRGLPLNPGWLGKKLFSDIFRAMNVSVIQQRLNRFLRIHRACRKQCICSAEKGIGALLWRREGKYSLQNTHVMQDKCLSFLLTMTYILLKGIVYTKNKDFVIIFTPSWWSKPVWWSFSHGRQKECFSRDKFSTNHEGPLVDADIKYAWSMNNQMFCFITNSVIHYLKLKL